MGFFLLEGRVELVKQPLTENPLKDTDNGGSKRLKLTSFTLTKTYVKKLLEELVTENVAKEEDPKEYE